jgi:hypothetical protein
MAITITSPDYDPGLTGITFIIDRENGTATSALPATEVSGFPGTYSLSTTIVNAPIGFNRVRMYEDSELAMIFAVQVIADGQATITGGSVQGLRDRAANQAEHDATQAAVADVQSRIPAALVNGRIDSNVSRWNGNTPGNLDSNGFVPGNTAAINGNTTAVSTFRTWLDNNRIDVALSSRASETNATANTNALGVTLTAGFAANITEHNATQDAIQTLADDTSGALIVLPNAVDGPERSTPAASDVFYLNESGLFVKQIKDTDGNPVDLSGFSLLFVAEIENGLDKFSEDNVTVGGTGDSYFTVTIPSSMTSKDGRTLIWSLRDRTDNKRTVLGKGKIVIEYAPDDLSVT